MQIQKLVVKIMETIMQIQKLIMKIMETIMQIQKLIMKIMETIMVWSMPGTGHYAAFCYLFGKFGSPQQAHPISSQAHYQAQWPGPGKFHNTLHTLFL